MSLRKNAKVEGGGGFFKTKHECFIVYILGLDLSDANQPGQVFSLSTDSSLDTGRKSFNLREMLKIGQQSITAIEQV